MCGSGFRVLHFFVVLWVLFYVVGGFRVSKEPRGSQPPGGPSAPAAPPPDFSSRVQGFGLKVGGLGLRVQGFVFRVLGAAFQMQGLPSFGSMIYDLGFRVAGVGFRVLLSGCRARLEHGKLPLKGCLAHKKQHSLLGLP